MKEGWIEKAKQARSPAELSALTKENEIELSDRQAEEIFDRLNRSGELSDEELDSVAGGGCHKKDGRLIVTLYHSCIRFKCDKCGQECTGPYMLNYGHACSNGHLDTCICGNCAHMSYEKGMWLCNHPSNRK